MARGAVLLVVGGGADDGPAGAALLPELMDPMSRLYRGFQRYDAHRPAP